MLSPYNSQGRFPIKVSSLRMPLMCLNHLGYLLPPLLSCVELHLSRNSCPCMWGCLQAADRYRLSSVLNSAARKGLCPYHSFDISHRYAILLTLHSSGLHCLIHFLPINAFFPLLGFIRITSVFVYALIPSPYLRGIASHNLTLSDVCCLLSPCILFHSPMCLLLGLFLTVVWFVYISLPCYIVLLLAFVKSCCQ